MLRKKLLYSFIAFTIFTSSVNVAKAQDDNSGFSLRKLFGLSPKVEEVFVDQHFQFDELDSYSIETQQFYRSRQYKPAWFNGQSLNKQGREFIEILNSSWEEGLPEPATYLSKVENALINMNKLSARNTSLPEIISEADVNLTLAWFEYASSLSSGIVDPSELHVIWEVLPEQPDLSHHLQKALGRGSIERSLDELKPGHQQYTLLLKAFRNLLVEKEKGGWPLPGFFPVLKEGDNDTNVAGIKKYLLATGDLEMTDEDYIKSSQFDVNLTQAVKKFQQRHGLQDDGIVGEGTLKQMNVPVDYRIDQIRLNIDRIRWLPDNFGKHHLLINIPDFSLEHIKNEETIQEMRVVVGRNENYTPVLEDTLYSIIFNPTWNLPNSIATHEVLPKLLEDTTYMERNNYTILRDSYISTDTIDYRNYDWSEVSRDSFPFFVVQHPGPMNSLGQVQFMLQNQYSIFLHDTPANNLFNIEQRDFSHGCIRLERPAELAVMLLRNQLPADTVIKYVSENEKKVVRLDEKIPVHILYKTAWVDENDLLHFREDIYGFDELAMPVMRKNFPFVATLRKKKS